MNMHLINHYGNVVKDTDEFLQFHDELIIHRYDSNFILLKLMPTIKQFVEIEKYLKTYHLLFRQNHLKFILPPNQTPPTELRTFFTSVGYDIGKLEMYTIIPSDFKGKHKNLNACWVTEENFQEFLELQFKEDIRFGFEFASAKTNFLERLFLRDEWRAVMIYEDNQAVGSLELIIKEDTVEIDNLFVLEAYRNKGLATQLQAFVMREYKDKRVILVADGEDTPKEMYLKQGYEFNGFQYEILKIGI